MSVNLLSPEHEVKKLLLGLAETARARSVSALPDEYGQVDDDYMKYALQMVVDGFAPDQLKRVLEMNRERICGKLERNLALFNGAVLAIQRGDMKAVRNLCGNAKAGP